MNDANANRGGALSFVSQQLLCVVCDMSSGDGGILLPTLVWKSQLVHPSFLGVPVLCGAANTSRVHTTSKL